MDDITIKLNDGVERVLRYSLASNKRLAKKFGKSMMRGDILKEIEEERFGAILFEGLRDRQGNPPADIPTADALDDLIDAPMVNELLIQFLKAWGGSNAPKNDGSAQAVPQPETPATVN